MHFPKESTPEPKDPNHQLLPVNMEPLLGFPPPANPMADIGDHIAAEKAINAAARYGESSPVVVKSEVMSYQKALKLGLEPISVTEDNQLANTPVRVVEMTGNFKRRRRRRGTNTLTFTKAYIILRAADGLELCIRLFAE